MDGVLDTKEKQDIYKFLINSYVVLPDNIKGQDFLFVHSMPPKNFNMLNYMKTTGKGLKFNELNERDYTFMLEERDRETYIDAKNFGFTTICGHTPEFGDIKKNREKGYLRMDAGCGHKRPEAKLALYCVEDDNIKYIDVQEKYNSKVPEFDEY